VGESSIISSAKQHIRARYHGPVEMRVEYFDPWHTDMIRTHAHTRREREREREREKKEERSVQTPYTTHQQNKTNTPEVQSV
jgi:hypothetical protein